MTYNENMRKKLKSNIIIVLFFLTIATGLLLWKLVQLYGQSPSLLEIQGVLLLKDYLVFIYFGYGLLALLASFLVYFKFDNYYPKTQVMLFTGVGVLFLPFTIIMVVIGIMKYIEKSTFKIQFIGSAVIALMIVAVGFSTSLTKLAEIEPEYMNQYVYNVLYENGPDNHIELEITATSRGMELQKVEITGFITLQQLNWVDFTAKGYTLKISDEGTDPLLCFEIVTAAELNQSEFECEMSEGQYFEEMSVLDFLDPTFEMQINPIVDGLLEIPYRHPVSIVSMEFIPNTYDVDSDLTE